MVYVDLFIPKDQIAYVKFILEAYEGLAVQSSMAGSSVVRWSVPQSRLKEALCLIEVLEKEAGVRIKEVPRIVA